MTPKQIREIAQTMNEFGITSLKLGQLEMTCRTPHLASLAPERVEHTQPSSVAPQYAEPEEKDIIEHKIEAMKSLMKLGDEDLVDALFPEPKEPSEEVA